MIRFVGLTAVNPLTLVYFIALAGAVTTRTGSAPAVVVFVVAVGHSSLAWQLLLAATGAIFKRSLRAKAGEAIGIAASLLIVALGGVILTSGLAAS